MMISTLPTIRLWLIGLLFIAQFVYSTIGISSDPEEEIRTTLALYAETERQMDLDAHMELYADTINFYGKSISKEELKSKFAPLFNKSESMEMQIDDIKIKMIRNDYATVEFNKFFMFMGKPGKNDFCGEVIAVHEIRKINGKWLTVGINESSVLWVEKKDCSDKNRISQADLDSKSGQDSIRIQFNVYTKRRSIGDTSSCNKDNLIACGFIWVKLSQSKRLKAWDRYDNYTFKTPPLCQKASSFDEMNRCIVIKAKELNWDNQLDAAAAEYLLLQSYTYEKNNYAALDNLYSLYKYKGMENEANYINKLLGK